jgi:hypothetical protein
MDSNSLKACSSCTLGLRGAALRRARAIGALSCTWANDLEVSNLDVKSANITSLRDNNKGFEPIQKYSYRKEVWKLRNRRA